MRDRFPLLLIGGLILLGVIGAYLSRGAARGSFADRLSTYRSQEDGTRGLFLLAEESGLPVTRLKKNLEVIEPRQNLALLGVEFGGGLEALLDGALNPDDEDDKAKQSGKGQDAAGHTGANLLHSRKVEVDERERLLEHVKQGATLLYVPRGSSDDSLLEALDVRLWKADDSTGRHTLAPAQPSPFTLGVERLEARVQAYLDLPQSAVPLIVDTQDEGVVAALVPYGQGQVVVIGAPELAMNSALARADNAQLWLSMLRATSATGPTAFDEFHHGFTSDRSFAEFAARHRLHFAAAQLLLGLMLWAGALRRFGKPHPPADDARVGSTDTLFAASRLYREGKHSAYAAMLIARHLAQELAAHAGLPWRVTPTEIAAGLAARGHTVLAEALREVVRLSQEAASDQDVVRVARQAASARQASLPQRVSVGAGVFRG